MQVATISKSALSSRLEDDFSKSISRWQERRARYRTGVASVTRVFMHGFSTAAAFIVHTIHTTPVDHVALCFNNERNNVIFHLQLPLIN